MEEPSSFMLPVTANDGLDIDSKRDLFEHVCASDGRHKGPYVGCHSQPNSQGRCASSVIFGK
jgi:hypothetical protein